MRTSVQSTDPLPEENHMRVGANHKIAAVAAGAAMVCGYAVPAMAADGPADTAVSASAGVRVVQPGQLIQAAIDAARPQTTIVVAGGVHHENLLVTKPLVLKGADGAVLMPAATVAPNVCTEDPDAPAGNDVGVCVLGALGPVPEGQDMPSVLSPVRNVVIEDIEVTGFTSGIVALGTRGLRIERVEVHHNAEAIFTEFGDHTTLVGNNVHDNAGPGFNVRGSTQVRLAGNSAAANQGEGMLVLNSHGGSITSNTLAGNCAGLTVVDTAEPGFAGDLRIAANAMRANNLYCAGDDEGRPSESGIGIGLLGTSRVLVERNTITGNVGAADPESGQPAFFGGAGLALIDGALVGGAAPTDNRISQNIIRDNQPLDVLTDGSGSGNAFSANDCVVANLPAICG
jgi:parallel beta-helix repeat protein